MREYAEESKKRKALGEIDQQQTSFRFQYPRECKSRPERFSSNSQSRRHIKASHTKIPVETSPTYQPFSPLAPQATLVLPSSPRTSRSSSHLESPALAPKQPKRSLPAAECNESAPPTPSRTPTVHVEIPPNFTLHHRPERSNSTKRPLALASNFWRGRFMLSSVKGWRRVWDLCRH